MVSRGEVCALAEAAKKAANSSVRRDRRIPVVDEGGELFDNVIDDMVWEQPIKNAFRVAGGTVPGCP